MQIDTPRYRGQFDYDSAYTRGTVRLAASGGLPVLLADHVNEPGLPNRLGPGLTLYDEALCDMARFEVRAMRTAVVSGRTLARECVTATSCMFFSQTVETLVSQDRREAGRESVHRSWA